MSDVFVPLGGSSCFIKSLLRTFKGRLFLWGGDGQKLQQFPLDRSLEVSSRLPRRDWPNDAVPTLTGSTWNIGPGWLEKMADGRSVEARTVRTQGPGRCGLAGWE